MKTKLLLLLLFITVAVKAQYTFEHTDIWVGNRASVPKHFTEYNGELYFQAKDNFQNEIWKTDGTTGNVTQVSDLNGNIGSTPESFKVLGPNLIFVAFESTTGTELYKYDGTNTTLLKDIRIGSSSGMTGNGNEDYEIFTELNNELFFMAQTQNGRELWKTDGTPNGTVLVKNFTETVGGITYNNYLRYMYKSQNRFLGVLLNNELYFTVNRLDSSGSQIGVALWKTNGTTAGTVLVKDTLLTSINEMIIYNNTLLFAGGTNTEGVELWKSDGTNAGTVIVEDKFPNNLAAFGKSSNPTQLIIFNNEVFYKGYGYDTITSEIIDYELYKTDGTTITLVKDINSGHQNTGISGPFKIFNNELYFRGKDDSSSPFGLWKTNGTEVGTVNVFEPGDVELNNNSLQFINTIIFNDELFFNNFQQLWKTDGTIAGTTQLSNDGTTNTPLSVSSFNFKIFNNKLWMRANNNVESDELWVLYSGTVSVNDTTLNHLKIYPNPVINTLNILGLETLQTYTIYNLLGKEIQTATINTNDTIDISQLKSGIYFLKVKSKNKTYTKKFIKQ